MDLLAHLDARVRAEVGVLPAQADRLADAQAGAQQEAHEQAVLVAGDRVEQGGGLDALVSGRSRSRAACSASSDARTLGTNRTPLAAFVWTCPSSAAVASIADSTARAIRTRDGERPRFSI